MNKVLLTGANGFLGKHLYSHFVADGFEVKTLSRTGDNIDYRIDIADSAAWDQLDFEPEIIINCAAILPGGNAGDENYVRSLFNTNCLGAYNLCKWVDKTISVKYILNVSSLSVIGKPWPIPLKEDSSAYPSGPHALYSLSKLNQEVLINSFQFSHPVKFAHARLSALFGPNMAWIGIMCSLIDKALKQEPITLSKGTKVSADFIYVTDVCRHFTTLVKKEAEGVINIASGEEVYLSDLAKFILNASGNKLDKLTNIETAGDYNRAVIDISKLKYLEPTFKNTDFVAALQTTIKYRQTSEH